MSARWQQVKEILQSALERPPDERGQFLNKACGDDESLRREIEALLASSENVGGFMERAAISEVAEMFAGAKNDLKIGECFSHYEIIRQIGAGGMGEVYLAQDKKLNRKVALKILSEKISRNEANLRRFSREAKAASALNHPNILVIHEIGESGETHYIVSEYVAGKTLREIFEQKTLKLPEVLDVSIQIAGALCAAHEARLVHRDIKPENIMLRPDGYVKILDFGLAKLVGRTKSFVNLEDETASANETAQGVILGTINYMSPEQAKGEPIDERTDIFSFGTVIYEMMTGRTPFAGGSMSETLANLINSDPQPLSRYAEGVPDELQRIVSKTLRKNKDERYQTMKGLHADLKDLRENLAFSERLEKSQMPDGKNATRILRAATGNANFETAETRDKSSRSIKRHRAAALAASATVALAVAGYFVFFATQSITSVAVLPFENGSNDANLNYLSDGLSESVIDRLSQLPQLKVIARSSSFKYRGENVDLRDAAKKLGAQAIVTGRVVQRGDNLSIRVEMVDARDNRQLWSGQFDRRTADALVVQQEIAQTVSEKLRLKLSGVQERQLASQGTSNAQAYDLLLRGDFFINKGGIENKKKAAEYYRQAIAFDPNYALGYAKLSAVYRNLIGFSVLDPKEFKPKAQAATQKAIELDENLGDAHLQLANSHSHEWNWAAAEAEYKRAIELNPNLIDARRQYAAFLTVVGRYDEALAEARRVAELDPLTLYTKLTVPYVLVSARRFDEAIAEFQKMLELDPNFSGTYLFLGNAYAGRGMFREAVAAFQEAIRYGDDGPSVQIYLGAAHAGAGEREKASDILKQLETSEKYVSPGELPVLYVALGEREKALASLEKAYEERDLHLQYLRVEPGFDALRDDPRFQNLVRRVGLPSP